MSIVDAPVLERAGDVGAEPRRSRARTGATPRSPRGRHPGPRTGRSTAPPRRRRRASTPGSAGTPAGHPVPDPAPRRLGLGDRRPIRSVRCPTTGGGGLADGPVAAVAARPVVPEPQAATTRRIGSRAVRRRRARGHGSSLAADMTGPRRAPARRGPVAGTRSPGSGGPVDIDHRGRSPPDRPEPPGAETLCGSASGWPPGPRGSPGRRTRISSIASRPLEGRPERGPAGGGAGDRVDGVLHGRVDAGARIRVVSTGHG